MPTGPIRPGWCGAAVAELYLDADADAALTALETGGRPGLLGAVNKVLDQLELDPGDRAVRQRRFEIGVWCAQVSGDGEAWVILWEPHPVEPDGVVIHYLGPASFA